MKKMKLTALAKELKINVNLLVKLKRDKLATWQYTGSGKNTLLTGDGAETLRLAVDAPLAVSNKLTGFVLRAANNPKWVYVTFQGRDGRFPVSITARKRGHLIGKYINVEAITDYEGITTYRYDQSSGRYND